MDRRLQCESIMARPRRVEFPGGIYHVMSRGNARQIVFADDEDRAAFLAYLCRVGCRLSWEILAYCLMENHYHLLLRTGDANLSRGMRDVNGWYATAFNRRHDRVGHLFQGRYKALVVDRGEYLMEVIRYIVRNPVRAGLCAAPEAWKWSSHAATMRRRRGFPCLSVDVVIGLFGSAQRAASDAFARFVAAAPDGGEALEPPAHPVVMGAEPFVAGVLSRSECRTPEVPRKERAAQSLCQYEEGADSRDDAIQQAYAGGAYSLAEIGRYFKLHYSTVSRICHSVQDSPRCGERAFDRTSIQDLTPVPPLLVAERGDRVEAGGAERREERAHQSHQHEDAGRERDELE
jgi:REP element-mobilizing transposase RayT